MLKGSLTLLWYLYSKKGFSPMILGSGYTIAHWFTVAGDATARSATSNIILWYCGGDRGCSIKIWIQQSYCYTIYACRIDLMHMTSQKSAPARWGSNEALTRAQSPIMQPAGQPLHAIPPGWPGPTHWPRGWYADALFQHNTCAQRDKSWPPTWRRCYGDVTSMHKLY